MSDNACKKSNAGDGKSSPSESLRDYRERMFGGEGRCEFNDQGECVKGYYYYYRQAEAALNRAHEIRKFEIDLLWKRTVYVGAFQTFLFAALGASFSVDSTEPHSVVHFLRFIVCAVGVYSSLFWLMMNKGSKFWYGNWEKHIDFLEDEFEGKLHKTVLCDDENLSYSVSRVNIAISCMFFVTWWILAVTFLSYFAAWSHCAMSYPYAKQIAIAIGALFLVLVPVFLYGSCALKSQFRGVSKGKCATMVEQRLPDKIKKWSPKC